MIISMYQILKNLKIKLKNDDFEKSLKFQKKWNITAEKERESVINAIKEVLEL